jgi:ankyrin repeat protein
VESDVSEVRKALYRGDRVAAETLARGVELNLFDAAALGDVERLRECIAAEPSIVNEWSADGFTALHFAAFLGGAASVRMLLDAGSDFSAVARNDMQVQPLHSATALGDVDACRALLDAGADPNAEQQGGFRPLDEALINDNAPLAALLRERGAQVSGNPLK